jgi:hypothetical protein
VEPLQQLPFQKAKIVSSAFLSHKHFQFGRRETKRMFTADFYDDWKLIKVGLWMSRNEAVGCRKGEICISEYRF